MSFDDVEEECKAQWEVLGSADKEVYEEKAKIVQEKKRLSLGAASRRQLEMLEAKEEKERKAKEKGPAWFYVVEPVTKPVVKVEVEDPNRMVGQVANSRACNKCEEANGEVIATNGSKEIWLHSHFRSQVVLKCRGCSTHFHLSCLGLAPGQSEETFKCTACAQARLY